MKPDASIVIVNWNAGGLLADCLASLGAGDEPLVELIVVDNASTDGSVPGALRSSGGTRLIRNAENVGFARACNQAIRGSAGRYVLLLNPDARLAGGALAALVGFMDRHPEAGAAGPALLNPDGSLQPSGWSVPSLRQLLAVHPLVARLLPAPDDPLRHRDFGRVAEVDEVSGACLIVRRAAIDGAGLLDERFFLYFEDVDWCLRLKRAGWKVYWVPDARVVHHWRSKTDPSPQASVHHQRSRLWYVRKHFGQGPWLLLRLLSVAVYGGLLITASLRGAGAEVRRYGSLLGATLRG